MSFFGNTCEHKYVWTKPIANKYTDRNEAFLLLHAFSPLPWNPLLRGRKSHPRNMQESLTSQLHLVHYSPRIRSQKPHSRSCRTWVHLNRIGACQCHTNMHGPTYRRCWNQDCSILMTKRDWRIVWSCTQKQYLTSQSPWKHWRIRVTWTSMYRWVLQWLTQSREDGFKEKEGRVSPSTEENYYLSQLGSIALAIVVRLR